MADTVLDTDTLAVGVFVIDSEGVETDEDDATGDTVKLDEDDFDDAGDGDVETLAVFDSVGMDETDAVTDTVADDEGALEMVGREEELGDPLVVLEGVGGEVMDDVAVPDPLLDDVTLVDGDTVGVPDVDVDGVLEPLRLDVTVTLVDGVVVTVGDVDGVALVDPLGVIDRVATAVTEEVGDVDTETVDEGDVDPDRETVGEPELV